VEVSARSSSEPLRPRASRRPGVRFGCFLAPHHPVGESPTLLFERDLELTALLDRLGYDEFWCGEHHSSGWEMIASPEMFLAAAGQRTSRIRLGTGVISLPYHHPFNVAQRLVQLDHMTRGRVIFGSGPGALPSDAFMLGIDPMVQRDRQDEALGVIRRLLSGEQGITVKSDWFELHDASLQLLPVQHDLPMAVASSISPSGMYLAGKYGIGVMSIASTSSAGLAALSTQWGFAESSAAESGAVVSRDDWRVLMSWHIAETREQARSEAVDGLHLWHNEYNVRVLGRPGATAVDDKWLLLDGATAPGGTTVVGTPDDLVAAIRHVQEVAGGFGVVLGFAHDWANHEATRRSWDLVARHVIPQVNGTTVALARSADYVAAHNVEFERRAGEAVMSKIMSHDGARNAFDRRQAGSAEDGVAELFRPGATRT
jgi:limonene 1,2-monooxygenase